MADINELIEQAKSEAEQKEKADKKYAEFVQSLENVIAQLKSKVPTADPTNQQASVWYKSNRVRGLAAAAVCLALSHFGIKADDGTVMDLISKGIDIFSTGGSFAGLAWALYGSVKAKGPVTFKGGE